MKSKIQIMLAGALVVASSVVAMAGGNAGASTPAGKQCYALNSSVLVGSITYTCIANTNAKTKKSQPYVYDKGTQMPTLPTTNFDLHPGALIWSDSESGTSGAPLNSNVWSVQGGKTGFGTGEVELSTSSAVAQDGTGGFAISAKCTSNCSNLATSNWTSARIWTNGKVNFQYGEIEAKIWMPSGSFNWPAFWMMGQSYTSLTSAPSVPWPNCGEIDIAEGLNNNSTESSTIHSNQPDTNTDWGGGSGLTQRSLLTGAQMTGGWHTYGILWSPNSIIFLLDGVAWASDTYTPATRQLMTTTRTGTNSYEYKTYGPGTVNPTLGGSWPFNQPFFILVNDAIGGVSQLTGTPTPASATMKVASVKYYQYTVGNTHYGTLTLH